MTMKNLNKIQKEYWNSFVLSLPREERPMNLNVHY